MGVRIPILEQNSCSYFKILTIFNHVHSLKFEEKTCSVFKIRKYSCSIFKIRTKDMFVI